MCSCNSDETCCDNVKRDIEKYDKWDSSERTMKVLNIWFIVSIELNIEKNGCKFLILTNNSISSKIRNNLLFMGMLSNF